MAPKNPRNPSKSAAPFIPPKQSRNATSGNSNLATAAKPNQSNDPGGTLKPQYSSTYRHTQKTITDMPVLRTVEREYGMLCYVTQRCRLSDIERRTRTQRMQDIDIQISGYIKLDKDDQKRRNKNKAGYAPSPTKENLVLTQSQLDDMVTYLMMVYAPDMDFFTATSSADKQKVATALTSEINDQGQLVGYYRHLAKFFGNAIRYNLGALSCNWEQHMGFVFESQPGGAINKKEGVVWEGNFLKSINMYNFLYDTSVHPCDLPLKGEYFAEVELITVSRAMKMEQDGKLYGMDRLITNGQYPVGMSSEQSFYIVPPCVRDDEWAGRGQGGMTTNWMKALREVGSENAPESQPTIELVHWVGWVNSKTMGLGPDDKIELWKVTMANGQYIVFAARLDDTHGMLPCACATPIEDDLGNDQRTFPEQLQPLNNFASFLLNTDKDAQRKNIYGLTLYDPRVIPGMGKAPDEMVSGIFPIKSSSSEVDIDKVFRHYNTATGTEQNVQKVAAILELMQKILPTDSLKQVTDLERATLYQAAATVQAGSRRNLKIARMIADQAMTRIKLMMIYNIYVNITQITYYDDQGQAQQVSPADLIDAKLELDVGTGLKGIDKLMQLQIFQYITNSVIQSQQAIQEIDIVKLLTYVASLAGDKTDLEQFRRAPQNPAPPPQAPMDPNDPNNPNNPQNAQNPPNPQNPQQR